MLSTISSLETFIMLQQLEHAAETGSTFKFLACFSMPNMIVAEAHSHLFTPMDNLATKSLTEACETVSVKQVFTLQDSHSGKPKHEAMQKELCIL